MFLVVCAVLAAAELVIGNGWIGLFLVGAASLVGAGLAAPRSMPPWLATTLVIGGALIGAMTLVWTVIGGLLAIALIAFSVMDTRRGDPPPSPA